MAFYFMPCKPARSVTRRNRASDVALAAMAVWPIVALAVVDPPRVDGWATRLRRHLRWVIAIKLLLIYLLFSLFFSSSQRPAIDATRVSDRLQINR